MWAAWFRASNLIGILLKSLHLEGLLGADLAGFHTYDYTQHFLRCVLRIPGYENHLGQIALSNRLVKAEIFPMGIDFYKYSQASSIPEVQKEKEGMSRVFDGCKVILSLDRLDYTKGIINRL